MKKIKFTCSSCQAKLRVPTHLAGVSAPCPKCGSTITAPTDLANVVDDSPRPSRKNEAPRREPAPVANPTAAVSAAPASAAKVSVSMSDGGRVSGRVVAAPLPTPQTEPPVSRELPLPDTQPPVVEPAAAPEVPIVEETIFIDPPTPEVPEEPSVSVPPPPPVADPAPVEHSAPVVDPIVETELDAPPAVPKTQPIRINPRPSQLPPVRDEELASVGELPRLDVNLAEQGAPGPDSFARNPATPGGPTKVQLPQPGTEAHQFSPDDFIIPSQEEVMAELPAEEVPEQAADVYPESGGVPIDEIEAEEPIVSDAALDESPEGYVHLELPPMESGPEEVVAPEQAPPDSFLTESDPVQDPSYQPAPEGGLDEGSFENLLSQQQQSESEQLAYEDTAPVAPTQLAEEPVPELLPNEATGLPGELPVELTNAPVQQIPGEPLGTERDVLDEMFGSSAESPGNTKKSTMIMLSILGATAIIAVCVTAVIIKAMGGLSVSEKGVGEAPAPMQSKESATSVGNAPALGSSEPSIADAPEVIDEVAKAPITPAQPKGSTVTLPGDTKKPVVIMDSSGSPPQQLDNLSAAEAARTIPKQSSAVIDAPAVSEPSALSIDERVQQIVNGDSSAKSGGDLSVIGGAPAIDPVESALEDFSNSIKTGAVPTGEQSASTAAAIPAEGAALPKTAKNYNPPASFDAPGPDDENQLGETHNLLDAFLRAPDWETRAKYAYLGDSLRPAMEDYYKAREFKSYGRFSTQLFQLEKDKEMGGPYWVYLISTSDVDQGIPVIIREEKGKLKVDWEIYSEFEDRHFVQFQKGAIASPHTFRLVVERVSDYYGPDREKFSNLGDYYVYQVNPPYGDLNEYSEYAFVKKDSDLAKELDAVVGLGEQPLAMIVTLEQKSFEHGSKHLVITEYVTEGWFR